MGAAQNERGKFPSQHQLNTQGQHGGREVDKTIYPKATNATGLRATPTPSHGKKPSVSAENLEEEINVKKMRVSKMSKLGGKLMRELE